jgi:hypothetical protein
MNNQTKTQFFNGSKIWIWFNILKKKIDFSSNLGLGFLLGVRGG